MIYRVLQLLYQGRPGATIASYIGTSPPHGFIYSSEALLHIKLKGLPENSAHRRVLLEIVMHMFCTAEHTL